MQAPPCENKSLWETVELGENQLNRFLPDVITTTSIYSQKLQEMGL